MIAHTWFHSVDPVANGNRMWFMLWLAALETGDKYVAREWPQRNKWIDGVGFPGPWAEPGSVKKLPGGGVRGPGQLTWERGFKGYAEEVLKVERELGAQLAQWQTRPAKDAPPIKVWRRIMDSRSGNTGSSADSQGRPLMEIMSDPVFGLAPEFDPAGKDAVAGSNRYTSIGEQMIADLLGYDAELAVLNPVTSKMDFNGRKPRLFINPECENLIDALQNYPGAAAGDSAWDDPVDALRYILIREPEYVRPRTVADEGEGEGW